FALEPPGTPGKDTHAAVGTQVTYVVLPGGPPANLQLVLDLENLALAGEIGLIVKGNFAGERRGFHYTGFDVYGSDRAGQSFSASTLRAVASPGAEMTYTAVPFGTQVRLGVDRDSDGFFDRD